MLKDMDFCHFLEIYQTNMENFTKTGINALKTASKKVITHSLTMQKMLILLCPGIIC